MTESDTGLRGFADFLARSGLKTTRQRERIVRAFFGAGRHISAEELYHQIRAAYASIGVVTVYRTLKLLRRAGLASERKFGDAYARFDPNPADWSHHHLICTRCGKIREFESTIRDMLPVETCLKAVVECGGPIVSICGGEPTIYPHLDEIVTELLRRKKFIYLCTNAIKLEKFLRKWKPSPYLTINVSMDGLEPTHDLVRSRKGLYQIDIRMIKLAKSLGYRVVTNTTVYKETKVEEIAQLFAELAGIGVDGLLVTPGYEYTILKGRDIFLEKQQTHEKFWRIWEFSKQYRILSTGCPVRARPLRPAAPSPMLDLLALSPLPPLLRV